ncbi:MAG TPA: RNA-binding protein [Blastocatellia bacterium]|nr:RNA-binding protein [Blastocatellia bacterium]
MNMKLYIGNLASETSDQDLEQLFAQAGTVEAVSIINDRNTGQPRGFAFVNMATREEGEAAIKQCNGQRLHRRSLIVKEAEPREHRDSYARSRATDWYS